MADEDVAPGDSSRPPDRVVEVTCVYCEVTGPATIFFQMQLRPIGSFSLAGAQMKASANWWPYMRCENCKHVSKGRWA